MENTALGRVCKLIPLPRQEAILPDRNSASETLCKHALALRFEKCGRCLHFCDLASEHREQQMAVLPAVRPACDLHFNLLPFSSYIQYRIHFLQKIAFCRSLIVCMYIQCMV